VRPRSAALWIAAAMLIVAPACARRGAGLASWYGPNYHGRMTANGERYNMLGLTAAHRTLPFNTYVRVTNVVNGRSLLVRINDRGPFVRGRIIDLSYTAAKILDIPETGTMKVTLEVLDAARGAAIHRRQEDLVRRKGVILWTEREFEEIRMAEGGV
jgi:rare lipoprotein A